MHGKPFILVQRKGWLYHKWEQVVSLPTYPNISPWHLLQHYVAKTCQQGPPGGPLFLSLQPPYKPLTANAINSLTRTLLASYGVPMSVYGAHSTRGAGVSFYKKLGLSSEEVCELGQWKNVQAFSSHYLRIGAASAAQQNFALPPIVHNVSPESCAEPEGSCTPRRNNLGGNDPEGEAQSSPESCAEPEGSNRGRK